MKVFRILVKVTFLFAFSFTFKFNLLAQSAEEGKTLFTANCTSCHSITERVVGPALKDVDKRHSEAWLLKWIKNSQALVKANDAEAVKVFNENNQSIMTPFEQFNEAQIKSILAFVKAEGAKPSGAATASMTGTATSQGSEAIQAEASDSLKSGVNWMIFVIAVLLIMVIALVFDILMRIGQIQGKPVVNWNLINSRLMLGFVLVGLVLVGWEFMVHGPLTINMQPPASEHASIYESMFMITLILTLIVFVITQGLLFWYGFKYKFDPNRKALYYPDNHRIEILWTVIPAIVLAVLVVRGLMTWNKIMYPKDDKALNVELFGYQFGWTARYAGIDNKLGAHDFRQVDKMNQMGVDTNDVKAADDMVSNELHVPVGRAVYLHFRSKDVIHSAFLPHFRVQMNVVPGLPTKFVFTPTITTAEMRTKMKNPNFDYIVLCNKICGSAHYRMKMKLVVDSPAEFYKWVQAQTPLVAKRSTSTPTATDSVSAKTMALNAAN